MNQKKIRVTKKKGDYADPIDSSLQDAAINKLGQSPVNQIDSNEKTPEELIYDLQVHKVELEIQAEELRQAHLALEESRDQYLDLYEFAPVGYITLTNAAIIAQANLTAAGLLGIDRKKLVNSPFRLWIIPEDKDTWDHYFTSLLQTDKKLTITCMLRRKDGTTFPARLESNRMARDHVNQTIRVAISDISDLKKIEEELRISEDRFRLAIQNAHISVAVQDTDLVYQWAYNQRTMPSEDFIGKRDTDLFIPGEAEFLTKLKRSILETGTEVHEKTWLTIDGKRMFFDIFFEPLYNNSGKITGIGIATIDLTDQKMIEDSLRQSEENLQRTQELLEAVTSGTDVIISAQDTNYRYIFFNQAYKEEIKRLTGKEIVLGSSMIELFEDIPTEQKTALEEWGKVLQGENVNKRLEFGNPGRYRKVYQVLHTPIRDAQGKIFAAGEVAYDVTNQVLIDEKLRETKNYLDNLITYANAPIIVWDPQFQITLFNRAFEQLTGRKAKSVIGKHLDILFHEQDIAAVINLIKKTVDGERWESVEIPILHSKGIIRTVLWNSANIVGADGKTIVSTIAQGQDITDRKKIESEISFRAQEYERLNETLNEEIRQRNISDVTLKKTLSLLNASLESTADGIIVVDNQARITSYNQNFVSMWNLHRDILESRDVERVLVHLLPQLRNPEEFSLNVDMFQSDPTRENFEMFEFIDGKVFERYSKPQIIGDVVVGRVWSFRDITDRKHAERKLIASLQEKEVLLREIHHRVKNNLQLISGLLDMTRLRTNDISIYRILTDMMLKIQTMAQIHTRLYESKQFGMINITEQIHDQIKSLSNIYSSKGHEINCEIESDDIFLSVDLALPCALVINEILSNAYKHAFRGINRGNIIISLSKKDDQIFMVIHDDGIGIPDTVDFTHSNSLGMKLIRTLIQYQLKGSLAIHRDQGTKVVVSFPLNPG